jgi:replicative DNA helicase
VSVGHDSERMVLAAILTTNSLLSEAEEFVRPEHFADDRHRAIFRAMQVLAEHDRPIDLITVRDELQTSIGIEKARGIAYLASLLDGTPMVTSLAHWANIVREKALRRAVIALGQRLVQSAGDESLATNVVIDSHSQQLNRILDAQAVGYSKHIAVVVKEAQAALDVFMQSGSGVTGVPTGLSDLDRLTSGFQPGTLNIVAARPSRGKTVFVMQVAIAAATAGFKGLCFSLEMPPDAVVLRSLLSDAEVDKWHDLKFAHDELRGRSLQKVAAAGGRMASLPLWFDPRESPTLTDIRTHCRKYQATHGLDFVVIDYLQRIPVDNKVDRHIGIGDIAQGLKSLSRQLKVPVIAACQLNRDAEETEPTLAHLGESGRIEKEADIVLMLHPEDVKTWQGAESPNVKLLVRKHRAGATDNLTVSFEKKYARFVQAGGISNWAGQL